MIGLKIFEAPRRSLLAIETKRIGDLILTTPALDAWKEAHPEGHLTLLAQPGSAAVGGMIRSVDSVVAVRGGNPALWHAWIARRYSECVDFTGTDRGLFLAAMARARRKVAFERFRSLPLRQRVFNEWVDSSVMKRHTLEHHYDALVPLLDGVQVAVPPLALRVPSGAVKRCETAMHHLGIGSSFFLVHPCSARAEKTWDRTRWAAVIDHAAGTSGLQPVIVSSALPGEVAQARRIAQLTKVPCTLAPGSFDLQGLAELISRARFQIGLDSAPMHLASAFRIPQIALFGPTNPYHWRPLQGPALVVTGGKVQEEFFPKSPPVSMRENDVEGVRDAVDRLLHLLPNRCGTA